MGSVQGGKAMVNAPGNLEHSRQKPTAEGCVGCVYCLSPNGLCIRHMAPEAGVLGLSYAMLSCDTS